MEQFGTIVFLHQYKRYGFVELDYGERVYFHASACGGKFDELVIDDRIVFEVGLDRKGKDVQALNIRLEK